jgi:Tol biopolymer transport system component
MRQLTVDSRYRDEYPSWSRNGYILFVRLDTKDNASLWTVNPNRGALRQIVENLDLDSGYYGHIEWDKYLAWQRN